MAGFSRRLVNRSRLQKCLGGAGRISRKLGGISFAAQSDARQTATPNYADADAHAV